MSIHVYNSLSKKKEELKPLAKNAINMYVCGVTVYDQSHIGHARSLYVFDYIRRYLIFRGFKVNFVRNITDIDDKIISKANELNESFEEVIKKNIEGYYNDLKGLGIDIADKEPRATENIDIMIKHVEKLIVDEYAYETGGDVYFSVRKFKTYGKLSGQSIDQMLEGVRIESGENKKDPLDFALWKKSKEGEPSWDSPWGKGRPGWHIECSCMSMKHLNTETLDIHAGGRDLIFPHHENEIAQSEALTGKPFANYWIHHGLLTINAQKMAKSLGNFITIEDALNEYGANDLKMFFLSSHYASSIDFSKEKMIEAHKANERIDIVFWKAHDLIKDQKIVSVQADFVEKHKNEFIKAMDDDFNTPQALASIFNLVTDVNKFIENNTNDENFLNIIQHAVDTLALLTKDILGLYTTDVDSGLGQDEEKLLQERTEARQNKDFKRSDELRDLLKEKGIIVEDTKDGQTWRWA